MTLTNTANPPSTPPGLFSALANTSTGGNCASKKKPQPYNPNPDPEDNNPPTISGGSS